MKVYSMATCFVPAKSHKVVPTFIYLVILSEYLATILVVAHHLPHEPLVCPRIIKPIYFSDLSLINGSLADGSLLIDLKLKNCVRSATSH